MRAAATDEDAFDGLSSVLVVAAVSGALLRAWIVVSQVGRMDADEAVWGLMAKHVLDGELPTFFWGQTYGGTLEAFLSAPFVAVFGAHKLTVEIVPILLHVAAALLVWRIGRRFLAEPLARVAAALYWVWPAYSLWKSTKAHGFYAAGTVLVLLAILLAFRLFERVTARDVALLGVVAGAGWWTTPQTIVVLVPVLVWLLVSRPAVFRSVYLLVAGALVGAAPWIVYSARHGWATTVSGSTVDSVGVWLDHLTGIFRRGWPAILGLRVPWQQDWLLSPWVGRALYAAVILGFVWLFARVMFGKKRELHAQTLLLILAMFPLILASSSDGFYTAEPRYFHLLVPVVVLLVVYALGRWTATIATIAVTLAVILSATGLALMARYETTAVHVPVPVELPPDVSPAIEVLEENDVRHVHTHYWISYLITFLTDERIIASPDTDTVRNAEWAAEVAADPEAAHVFVMGSGLEGPYVESLEAAGTPYERIEAEEFVVYLPHPV